MRAMVLSLFILTISFVLAPDAAAQYNCVDCPTVDCSYERPGGTIVVTTAPRCNYSNPCQVPGCRDDCHNVANCGGCMGWSCYIWPSNDPVLRQERAQISVRAKTAKNVKIAKRR